MIILVDQDGVIADFERGFLDEWRRRDLSAPFVPIQDRRSFYVKDQYPAELRADVEAIYFAPGFYRSLPPVPGAIGALKTLVQMGHDVRICTAPLSKYENCILEKYEWVEKHLGRDFTKRVILSKDKTLIRGSFLIDDRPEIEASGDAEWEHIIFDAPYNRHAQGKRLDWTNYLTVLT